jgi:hypothetical protein
VTLPGHARNGPSPDALYIMSTPERLADEPRLDFRCSEKVILILRDRPPANQRADVSDQIARKRRLRSSSKKFVELVVRTDPCPLDSITAPFSDDTNVPTYSYRPIIGVTAELFELKRIVSGIFQK